MNTSRGRVRRAALGLALVAAMAACGSPGSAQANATLAEAGDLTNDATTSTPAAPLATTAPVATALPAPTALVVPPPPTVTTSVTAPDSATQTVDPAREETAEPTGAPAASAPPATPRPAPAPVTPTAVLTPAAVPASASNLQAVLVANGSEVYTLNCANCHGENGLGSFQYRGIWGVGSRYSTAGLTAELTSGHPFTFGFADKLSADEIASVVAYVLATF